MQKPNRDPREDFPKPIMQQGVLNFEDLKTGMTVRGKVKNVVDFGAFIDLGIKETALLHISQMSDSFVSNPIEHVKVGDILECKILEIDEVRKRISLTRRNEQRTTSSDTATKKVIVKKTDDGKRVVIKAKASNKPKDATLEKHNAPRPERSRRDDDGMTYNPFADFFKNKK